MLHHRDDGVDPGPFADAGGHGVARLDQPVLDGETSAVDTVGVLRIPPDLVPGDLPRSEGGIADEHPGKEAPLEGGAVDERFEDGTHGPLRLRGAVELAVGEIASADEGTDRAAVVLEHDGGGLEVGGIARAIGRVGRMREGGAVFQFGETGLHRGLGGGLETEVEGGLDLEPPDADMGGEKRLHRFIDELEEVRLLGDLRLLPQHAHPSFLRQHLGAREAEGLRLLFGDHALVGHAVEGAAHLAEGGIVVAEGRKAVRRADHSGDHGGLGQGKLGGVFAEIAARGLLDSVHPRAEEDAIHVVGKDLILRVVVFDATRDRHLEELALHRATGEAEGHAGELHRQGARALDGAFFLEVPQPRPDEAAMVDTVVLVKTRVLTRDEGLEEMRRNLLERQGRADILTVEVADEGTGRIGHGRLHRHTADRGEIVARRLTIVVEEDQRGDEEGGAAADKDDEDEEPDQRQGEEAAPTREFRFLPFPGRNDPFARTFGGTGHRADGRSRSAAPPLRSWRG